ncbi:MAG: calcium/sodium antiporter [Clostridia bacterium]|nr:calcium/sodium antiporter [Clostridia bacterium]
MLVAVLLFALGLVLLIKGGDWFVDGATGVAHRFHIPEILIGATVVSIGTTLPEVMVSATSAVTGHGEIAYGNAIGSIICNTALIAALTVAVRPTATDKKSLRIPVLFFFSSMVLYSFSAYVLGEFPRYIGVILLAVFVGYIVLSVISAKKHPELAAEEPEEETEAKPSLLDKIFSFPHGDLVKDILLLAVGAALIAVGADLLVDNGTVIATELGVPESVIALTFVALGTSLPELVTAVTALIKGHSSLSLGNIVGANLFNLVLVGGVAVTLNPFVVPASKLIGGLNASLLIDIPLAALVMAILTVPALIRGKLSRAQGIVLLCLYTGFIAFQFIA